jgi:uncharacterized protein YndB with AHSA1/START domain
MTRRVPASPEVVFAAFMDPDSVARWWGPEGFEIPSLEYRPRVGERYRIEMQPPEGEAFHLTGEFRAIERPRRLAFTFVWEPPDPDDVETLVELELSDAGDATELGLVQGAFKTEARRDLHRDGWSDTLERLERFLAARA